ncbi:hypothetical protein ACVLV4_000425 [Rathayibacter agropyri]
MATTSLTPSLKRIAKSELPELLVPLALRGEVAYHVETKILEGTLLHITVVVDGIHEDDHWAAIQDPYHRGILPFLPLSLTAIEENAERIASILNQLFVVTHGDMFQARETVFEAAVWDNYFMVFRDAVRAAGLSWSDDEIDHRVTVSLTWEPKEALTADDVFAAYFIRKAAFHLAH